METGKVKLSNHFYIADMLYRAIFGQIRNVALSAVETNEKQKNRRKSNIRFSENPATTHGLGWRKDA